MTTINEIDLISQYLTLCNEQQHILRNYYTTIQMINRNTSEILLEYLRRQRENNTNAQNSTTVNYTNNRPVISHTTPSPFPSSIRQRLPIFARLRPPPIRPP